MHAASGYRIGVAIGNIQILCPINAAGDSLVKRQRFGDNPDSPLPSKRIIATVGNNIQHELTYSLKAGLQPESFRSLKLA